MLTLPLNKMLRYVAVLALALLVVPLSAAFTLDMNSLVFSSPLEQNKEEEGTSEETQNKFDKLKESLNNITSLLDPIEELMQTGFPQEQAGTGGTEGADDTSSGGSYSSSGSVSGTGSGIGTETGTGTGTGTDSGAGTGTGTNTGADTETGTDTGVDTGADTGSDSETEEVEKEGLKETVFHGSHSEEFTDRHYTCFVEDVAPEISGLCASRVHDNILYFVNDNGDSIIYAFNVSDNCKIVSKITLGEIDKGDWEDMACAPCRSEPDHYCIYVSDSGKVDGDNVNLVYIVKEPDLLEETLEYSPSDTETIDYTTSLDDLQDVQTLMVSPKTGDIFVMGKTGDYYPLYKLKYSGGKYYPSKQFYVKLGNDETGPRAGDISPDGTVWLFKMKESVYKFFVEDESNLRYVLTSSSKLQKLTYSRERYGMTIAWSQTGGSYFTVSEGENEPVYRYFRLA